MALKLIFQQCQTGWAGAIAGALLAFYPIAAFAQNITLDGTLGPTGTLIGPNYTIPQAVGTTVGSNLFHSFGRFSLDTGEIANFQSAANIRNILSRVTGGFPSTIDGLIFTQSANINLFLINPSGIIFGPNARLDIGSSTRGSFVATTVDAITFANGGQFSATNPSGSSSLLTLVGDPSGFLASQRSPGSIVSASRDLSVYEGQSLLLLGGDVTLDSSFTSVQFATTGGRVELGGILEAGTVGLQANGNLLSLNFPNNLIKANVSLVNKSTVQVVAGGGGSIAVNAQNLGISNGSRLLAGVGPGVSTVNNQSGDITLNVSNAIKLDSGRVVNAVLQDSVGKSGNILITTGTLSLFGKDARIDSSVFGKGSAGDIIIRARDAITVDGRNSIVSSVKVGAEGKGGNIQINTGSLFATNGGQVGTSVLSNAVGSAGNVSINARDQIFFDGFNSGAFSGVNPDAIGNGGSVQISTKSFSLTGNGVLSTVAFGQGNAGSITVDADRIFLEGSNILSFVNEIGNAGDIRIDTGTLLVTAGSQIDTTTFGQGNAGAIIIRAQNNVSFDGTDSDGIVQSSAFSAVEEGAQGNSGGIFITTGSLSVTNGAQLIADTLGRGQAGDIVIQARDAVVFDGIGGNSNRSSAAFTSVGANAQGNGGTIQINAGLLAVTNGAQLIANTQGQGNAGNIQVNVLGSVNVAGRSAVGDRTSAFLTFTESSKPGGDIVINAGSLQVSNTAFLDARSKSSGNGGTIRIAVDSLKVTNAGKLLTTAESSGAAGNIEISARSVQLNDQGRFSAESASGNGGNINLNVQDILLLRRGSQISTTAGTAQAGGDGGNININSKFIVAVLSENSDITANAFTGSGGKVNITAQGIFGLKFQPKLTPFSDITASSQFGISGTVTLNLLNVDPSRGLVALPIALTDPSQQISQDCKPGSKTAASSFVATGRGGIPLSPDEPLESRAVVTKWVPLPEENGADAGKWGRGSGETSQFGSTGSPEAKTQNSKLKTPVPIVEAQGWIVGADGVVELVANTPTGDRANFWTESLTCRTTQGN